MVFLHNITYAPCNLNDFASVAGSLANSSSVELLFTVTVVGILVQLIFIASLQANNVAINMCSASMPMSFLQTN